MHALRASHATLEESTLPEETWTPYALEPIRIQHVRRRLIMAILAILALLLLAYLLYQYSTTTQKEFQIFQNGKQVGGSIQIDTPESAPRKDHVTVGVSAGQVTRVDTGQDPDTPGASRALLPTFDRAAPYNWTAYLVAYGPYLLVILAAYWLTKRRGKYDEINFGVYKGAMPLEMITASHEKVVFTRSFAKSSVFGKRRSDHLPATVLRAHRDVEE